VQPIAVEKSQDHQIGNWWRQQAVDKCHDNRPGKNAPNCAEQPTLPARALAPENFQTLRDCNLHRLSFTVTQDRINTGKIGLAAPIDTAFTMALGSAAQLIEAAFEAALPEDPKDRLRVAMRYSVLGQGKRLRPFFVLESCKLHNVDGEMALAVATALECVHCYSLVHDDLPAMDNDDLRRAQPTLHRKFDEATAILAGDALLTFAFDILASAPAPLRVISAMAKAAGPSGMVGGQMLDILAEKQGFKSIEDISSMQRMKTGALFDFACSAGPLISETDPTSMKRYADNVGLAFQIVDDVLDVEATPGELGKATQKDRAKCKATFVDLLGLDGAKAEAKRLVTEAISALEQYGENADVFRQAAQFTISRRK
jgi:farnesyl diphosphate synthase